MLRSLFARRRHAVIAQSRGRARGSLAQRLATERLEGRALLAAFSYDALSSVVAVSLADGEQLTSTAQGGGNYVLSLAGGATFSGTDIPTRLVGNGLSTLTIDGDLTVSRVAITGTGTTADVAFGTSTGLYVDDFAIALSTAFGDVTVGAPTTFNGTAGLAVSAARSVSVLAPLATGIGDILLDADDGVQRAGTFAGVAVDGGSITTAGGSITLEGRGGDGEGFSGYQIGVAITTLGLVRAGDNGTLHGSLTIRGVGGNALSEGPFSHGVFVDKTSALRTTGGALSVTGTGGARDGSNDGLLVEGTVATLTGSGPTDTGAITLTGTGGGAVPSDFNRGVVLTSTAIVTSVAGAISITGDGGDGTPTTAPGLLFDGATLTSSTGNITLTADSFVTTLSGGALVTTATVTIRNLVAGQVLPISVAAVPMIQAIGASRIVVGRSDPGLLPVIDQEGGANLSLPGIALEMRGGDIILRADVSTAGAPQTYAGPIRLGVAPAAADVTLTGSLVTLGGTVTGNERALAIAGSAVTQGAIAGLTTFAVSGSTSLGADVGSSGNQLYVGPVTLTGPARLDTGTLAGDITMQSTLDGPFNLTLAAGGGSVLLDGVVGGLASLASITLESAGSVTVPRSVSIDGALPGAGLRGIDVAAGVSNVRFSGGGSIRNPGMQGIRFNGTSTNSLVRGFTITAAGMTGIKFATGDYGGTTVIGNTIDGAGLSTYGFRLGSATGLSIGGGLLGDGNRVTGTYQGLYASGGLAGTSVIGNLFIANTSGVILDAVTGLAFGNGNQVRSSTAFGVYVGGVGTGTRIEGNTLVENPVGMYLDFARGITIRDNVMVRNAAQGLYARGICTDTIVVDNSIFGGGGVGLYGIYLAGARGMTIGGAGGGNDIAGTTQGLFAFGTLTGTVIADNLIENNETGVVLLSARELTINASNRIRSNAAWGLFGSGDCAGTTVLANAIQSNKAGIYLSAVTGITVGTETAGTGNTISANQFGLFASGVSTGTSVLGNTITGNVTNITVDPTAAATGTFQAT
jgi:parallel beta-helix repeat protein